MAEALFMYIAMTKLNTVHTSLKIWQYLGSVLFVFVFEGSTHSNIQITKGVNIHNNVQKIIFREVL